MPLLEPMCATAGNKILKNLFQCRASTAEFVEQPGSGKGPMAVGGPPGNPE